MQDINVAVIGAPTTGKSTFIRRALGLPDSTPATNCSRKWTIDGTTYVVRFIEMTYSDVLSGERNTFKWPESIHGLATPRMDGVITMYDVTDQCSLAKVPDMLSECRSVFELKPAC